MSIMEYLIDRGANINIKNKNGDTPLTVACERGYKKVVEYLIEHGTEVNEVNGNGYSPLTLGCKYVKENDMQILMNYGIDVGYGNSSMMECRKKLQKHSRFNTIFSRTWRRCQ